MKGRYHLEDLGTDNWIILNWILKEEVSRDSAVRISTGYALDSQGVEFESR
jgi:hypothetical protein